MNQDLIILIAVTAIDAGYIYAIVKQEGAGTEITLLTMALTIVLAIVWSLLFHAVLTGGI